MNGDNKIWFYVLLMISAYLISATLIFNYSITSDYKSLLFTDDGIPIPYIF
jgi:hypothetical protein